MLKFPYWALGGVGRLHCGFSSHEIQAWVPSSELKQRYKNGLYYRGGAVLHHSKAIMLEATVSRDRNNIFISPAKIEVTTVSNPSIYFYSLGVFGASVFSGRALLILLESAFFCCFASMVSPLLFYLPDMSKQHLKWKFKNFKIEQSQIRYPKLLKTSILEFDCNRPQPQG